ncbi:MAG TPA: GNAT family N-acetyltransferase [Burkholderiales bacterium]
MTCSDQVRFRELDASPEGLAELSRFYRRAYVREFPDPDERESLANMKRYLRLKAQGWYGRNNYHIVLAELEGEPIGGSVLDYVAEPNAGIIEFLFIGAEHRLKGLGKSLLDETARILERDAHTAAAKPLAAIVAEMNDPFRPSDTLDNLDPFERCAMWGKWGFGKLGFPYVQPALSRSQKPVEGLALIARPTDGSAAVAAPWVLSVVGEYMRWAMRIDDPARNRQYQEMERFLGVHARIPLIPLQSYVGRDPNKALQVREVGASDGSFQRVLQLLKDAIRQPTRIASASDFRRALSAPRSRHGSYHLWSLHRGDAGTAEGLASFFALRSAGFGGYVVLGSGLQGKGLLRGLLARIEEAMIRDVPGANGWFIECDDEASVPFRHVGFHEVTLDYRPPALGGRNKATERLHLLYKPFGTVYAPPILERKFVLGAIAAILKRVYGVRSPRTHPSYLRASASFEKGYTGASFMT